MIITVQGYYGKKSKAAQTACVLAGMLAMGEGSKTLLLQMVDKDIDTLENMLAGISHNRRAFAENENVFTDGGIDALIRTANTTKLTGDDFERLCIPLISSKNMFDVSAVTNAVAFEKQLVTKEQDLLSLLKSASEVYDYIVMYGPCKQPETTALLNKYADKSVYCITQGYKPRKEVPGKDVIYLVTDYEKNSAISFNSIKKEYLASKKKTEKAHVMKLSRDVAVRDAAVMGNLLKFLRDNRNVSEYESTYDWYLDIRKIISYIAGTENPFDKEYHWEKFESNTFVDGDLGAEAKAEKKRRQKDANGIVKAEQARTSSGNVEYPLAFVEPKEKQGFFGRLFHKNKKLSQPVLTDVTVKQSQSSLSQTMPVRGNVSPIVMDPVKEEDDFMRDILADDVKEVLADLDFDTQEEDNIEEKTEEGNYVSDTDNVKFDQWENEIGDFSAADDENVDLEDGYKEYDASNEKPNHTPVSYNKLEVAPEPVPVIDSSPKVDYGEYTSGQLWDMWEDGELTDQELNDALAQIGE